MPARCRRAERSVGGPGLLERATPGLAAREAIGEGVPAPWTRMIPLKPATSPQRSRAARRIPGQASALAGEPKNAAPSQEAEAC